MLKSRVMHEAQYSLDSIENVWAYANYNINKLSNTFIV